VIACRDEHHDDRAPRALREKLGVACERNAGVVDDALVHRRGDDRGELAGRRAFGGTRERRENVRCVARIERAGHCGGAERHRHNPDVARCARFDRVAVVALDAERNPGCARAARDEIGIGDGDEIRRDIGRGELCDELRAYAGGLAGGDGEAR
jgi:hypothetical protein